MKNSLFIAAVMLAFVAQISAQKTSRIAFYNVENLYDTINDPEVDDEEFLPQGKNKWTGERFEKKLNNLARVIDSLGGGPSVLGMCEVENKYVLEQLIDNPRLKGKGFGIVHHNSPDKRGIDVSLIYKKEDFTPSRSMGLRVKLPGDSAYPTRDILLVSGNLCGKPVFIFVNHWPSRSGGEERSIPARAAAAATAKKCIDSIMALNPNSKVVLMGDLNDDPVSPSLTKVLGCKADPEKTKSYELFNPWVDNYKKGIGTSPYQDAWGLFDQVLFSGAWINKDQEGYRFFKHVLFNKEFMVQKTGRYRGYSKRTWDGTTYNYGYSDHFPVYVMMVKKINQ
jgi:hypothetical protein